MIDLHEEIATLRPLMGQKPSPPRRALVTRALGSKFDGLRSVAVQVLGAWGDPQSVALLRRMLEEELAREPTGGSLRGVLTTAVARNLAPSDATWVLPLYFSRPSKLLKHELLPLLGALPAAATRDGLLAGARATDAETRHAALKGFVIQNFQEKRSLISQFENDPDTYVRDAARSILADLRQPRL